MFKDDKKKAVERKDDTTNYEAIYNQLMNMTKMYHVFQQGAELASVLVGGRERISNLKAEIKELQAARKHEIEQTEIVSSKLKIKRDEVDKKNRTISDKVQRVEELNRFLEEGWKKKESEINKEAVDLRASKMLELQSLNQEIKAKQDECLALDRTIAETKKSIASLRKSLISVAG